jgi:4-hydroxy-tetrahydrodipicolinate reductase
MTLRIGIGGIGGRMGREIVAAAEIADSNATVVGGVERSETIPAVQASLGPERRVVDSIATLLPDIDVFVDFSTPSGTIAHATACADAGKPFVSGVTGLSANQIENLATLARTTPIFYSRNMSLGISALIAVLPVLVRALDGYDLEIIETHHRHKRDSPSGTALALAEAITRSLDVDLSAKAIYGREGIAPRSPGEIGIHAIRAGGNAGEHTILLAHEGEELRLSHRALSRNTFAFGAIRASHYIVDQSPGLYSMTDLLEI